MAVNFINKYPYTDFHELNLDWVIKELSKKAPGRWVTITIHPDEWDGDGLCTCTRHRHKVSEYKQSFGKT